MRGARPDQPILFSYIPLEDRIPPDHPLRQIRTLVDEVLAGLSGDFSRMYSRRGRPSVPPEQLLRALLIQILYSVRSERQLMEQLEYNLLFRWFVGLSMDDTVWVPTTFTKNRERLLKADVAVSFFQGVLEQARRRRLLSEEHFTVDGTLLEAWASQKSFRPKGPGGPADPAGAGRNEAVDFRGEKRSNQTHVSTTDPDARLARKKGKEAKLCYSASALMDNRHGLLVDAEVRHATGRAEIEAGLDMLERQLRKQRCTVGADKLYDVREFIEGCRSLKVTPHVAQNTSGRRSGIDRRTTRHPGYAVSQRKRKQVEECFGWKKTVGGLRRLRHRGLRLVDWIFTFTAAAYNLVRMRRLIATGVCA